MNEYQDIVNYITNWGKGIGLSCRKCRERWRATFLGWHQKKEVRWKMQQRRKQRKDLTQRTHQTGLHPIKLLTLLGKTWLRQGLWNVPMGHILDPRWVTGDFQKPTFIAYYQMGRQLSETGCYIQRKLHEISNHHTDAYLSRFSRFKFFFSSHTQLYRI